MTETLSEINTRCDRARVDLVTRNMAERARHKKTGHIYRVIGVCSNCTNGEHDGETMVLYRREFGGISVPLYRKFCGIPGPLFVRNVDEFLEKFEACD